MKKQAQKIPFYILLVVVASIGFVMATAGYGEDADIVRFETHRIKAALGDNAEKMRVAQFYLTGTDVKPDDLKAAKWVRCAADKGDERAIGYMGLLHMGGIGVEQSFPKAREWLTKSNDPRAIELALTLQTFDRAMEILPPAERDEKIKANYAAAQEDIRKVLMQKLAEENTAQAPQQDKDNGAK